MHRKAVFTPPSGIRVGALADGLRFDSGQAIVADRLAASASPRADRDAQIGLRIRTLRRARGWTQEQLALACRVTRSAIAQWESGRAGQQAHNLVAVAQALAVDIDVLRYGGHLIGDPLIAQDERALLELFRRCSQAQQELLLGVARSFVGDDRIVASQPETATEIPTMTIGQSAVRAKMAGRPGGRDPHVSI